MSDQTLFALLFLGCLMVAGVLSLLVSAIAFKYLGDEMPFSIKAINGLLGFNAGTVPAILFTYMA